MAPKQDDLSCDDENHTSGKLDTEVELGEEEESVESRRKQKSATTRERRGSGNTSSSSNKATKKKKHGSRSSTARETSRESLLNFVPAYLRPYVFPCHGDFCYTLCFHPRFVAQLMSEGFLPIATDNRVLLPKIHQNRCVISLTGGRKASDNDNAVSANKNLSSGSNLNMETAADNRATPRDNSPDTNGSINGNLHIRKSVRKKAKRFEVSINQCFDEVIKGCHKQHGSHCWLYPQLVEAFRYMHQMSTRDHADGGIYVPQRDSTTGNPTPNKQYIVRFYTIEIWNAETGKLAGGEIGYTVGDIYTSLTGFSSEDSAGSVQLVALGKLLQNSGFSLWDLGMEMDYKRELGSYCMPRKQFVAYVHNSRQNYPNTKLMLQPKEASTQPLPKSKAIKVNAKNILDYDPYAPPATLPNKSKTKTKVKNKNKNDIKENKNSKKSLYSPDHAKQLSENKDTHVVLGHTHPRPVSSSHAARSSGSSSSPSREPQAKKNRSTN